MIDGRYESLGSRNVADGVVRHMATAADGTSVVVDVYDVTGDDEGNFEAFRRALKLLARQGHALLVDVVARPGAHYVVWQANDTAGAVELDAVWSERLTALGLDATRAELITVGRRTYLVGMERGNDRDVDDALTATSDRTASPTARGRGRARRWFGRSRSAQDDPKARRWIVGPAVSTAVAALVLVLAGFVAAGIGAVRGANAEDVRIPVVVGMPLDEAVATLTARGLVPTARPVVSRIGDGTVLATDPDGETWVRPGRTVTVDVAVLQDGSTVVEVPDVVAGDLTEARRRLEAAGLALGNVARVAARRPVGSILAQRPQRGFESPPGTAVDVVVSTGPSVTTTFLPNLVGLGEETARAIALDAGFSRDHVVVDPVSALDVPVGTVLAMTPAAWHSVRVDEVTVRLLVADPTGSVALRTNDADASRDVDARRPVAPDLIGLPSHEALGRARSAGLQVTVQRVVDSALPTGVVAQVPAPGSTVSGAIVVTLNQRPIALPAPAPTVTVRLPRPRDVAYEFFVEPGIPVQTARVLATAADGVTHVVLERSVVGGDTLAGTWQTIEAGPVVFALTLNDIPYLEIRVADGGTPTDP